MTESTVKSNTDSKNHPTFQKRKQKRPYKRLKRHKAHGIDGISSDIITRGEVGGGGGGGRKCSHHLTNIFNSILKEGRYLKVGTKQNIFKMRRTENFKNYRPLSLLSRSYKIITRLLQSRTE